MSLASVGSQLSALGNILGSEFELEITLESDDGFSSDEDEELFLDMQLGLLSSLIGSNGSNGGAGASSFTGGRGGPTPAASSNRSRANSVAAVPDEILEAIVATALNVLDAGNDSDDDDESDGDSGDTYDSEDSDPDCSSASGSGGSGSDEESDSSGGGGNDGRRRRVTLTRKRVRSSGPSAASQSTAARMRDLSLPGYTDDGDGSDIVLAIQRASGRRDSISGIMNRTTVHGSAALQAAAAAATAALSSSSSSSMSSARPGAASNAPNARQMSTVGGARGGPLPGSAAAGSAARQGSPLRPGSAAPGGAKPGPPRGPAVMTLPSLSESAANARRAAAAAAAASGGAVTPGGAPPTPVRTGGPATAPNGQPLARTRPPPGAGATTPSGAASPVKAAPGAAGQQGLGPASGGAPGRPGVSARRPVFPGPAMRFEASAGEVPRLSALANSAPQQHSTPAPAPGRPRGKPTGPASVGSAASSTGGHSVTFDTMGGAGRGGVGSASAAAAAAVLTRSRRRSRGESLAMGRGQGQLLSGSLLGPADGTPGASGAAVTFTVSSLTGGALRGPRELAPLPPVAAAAASAGVAAAAPTPGPSASPTAPSGTPAPGSSIAGCGGSGSDMFSSALGSPHAVAAGMAISDEPYEASDVVAAAAPAHHGGKGKGKGKEKGEGKGKEKGDREGKGHKRPKDKERRKGGSKGGSKTAGSIASVDEVQQQQALAEGGSGAAGSSSGAQALMQHADSEGGAASSSSPVAGSFIDYAYDPSRNVVRLRRVGEGWVALQPPLGLAEQLGIATMSASSTAPSSPMVEGLQSAVKGGVPIIGAGGLQLPGSLPLVAANAVSVPILATGALIPGLRSMDDEGGGSARSSSGAAEAPLPSRHRSLSIGLGLGSGEGDVAVSTAASHAPLPRSGVIGGLSLPAELVASLSPLISAAAVKSMAAAHAAAAVPPARPALDAALDAPAPPSPGIAAMAMAARAPASPEALALLDVSGSSVFTSSGAVGATATAGPGAPADLGSPGPAAAAAASASVASLAHGGKAARSRGGSTATCVQGGAQDATTAPASPAARAVDSWLNEPLTAHKRSVGSVAEAASGLLLDAGAAPGSNHRLRSCTMASLASLQAPPSRRGSDAGSSVVSSLAGAGLMSPVMSGVGGAALPPGSGAGSAVRVRARTGSFSYPSMLQAAVMSAAAMNASSSSYTVGGIGSASHQSAGSAASSSGGALGPSSGSDASLDIGLHLPASLLLQGPGASELTAHGHPRGARPRSRSRSRGMSFDAGSAPGTPAATLPPGALHPPGSALFSPPSAGPHSGTGSTTPVLAGASHLLHGLPPGLMLGPSGMLPVDAGVPLGTLRKRPRGGSETSTEGSSAAAAAGAPGTAPSKRMRADSLSAAHLLAPMLLGPSSASDGSADAAPGGGRRSRSASTTATASALAVGSVRGATPSGDSTASAGGSDALGAASGDEAGTAAGTSVRWTCPSAPWPLTVRADGSRPILRLLDGQWRVAYVRPDAGTLPLGVATARDGSSAGRYDWSGLPRQLTLEGSAGPSKGSSSVLRLPNGDRLRMPTAPFPLESVRRLLPEPFSLLPLPVQLNRIDAHAGAGAAGAATPSTSAEASAAGASSAATSAAAPAAAAASAPGSAKKKACPGGVASGGSKGKAAVHPALAALLPSETTVRVAPGDVLASLRYSQQSARTADAADYEEDEDEDAELDRQAWLALLRHAAAAAGVLPAQPTGAAASDASSAAGGASGAAAAAETAALLNALGGLPFFVADGTGRVPVVPRTGATPMSAPDLQAELATVVLSSGHGASIHAPLPVVARLDQAAADAAGRVSAPLRAAVQALASSPSTSGDAPVPSDATCTYMLTIARDESAGGYRLVPIAVLHSNDDAAAEAESAGSVSNIGSAGSGAASETAAPGASAVSAVALPQLRVEGRLGAAQQVPLHVVSLTAPSAAAVATGSFMPGALAARGWQLDRATSAIVPRVAVPVSGLAPLTTTTALAGLFGPSVHATLV